MSQWRPFRQGATAGHRGSEGGAIVCDEEYADASRITLERGGHSPWSITCGVYGWMVHTCLFGTQSQARAAYEQMKCALEEIVELTANEIVDYQRIGRALQEFVERFQ